PTAFGLRDPSLDDVFLALTGRRTEGDADADGHDPGPSRRRGRRRRRGPEPGVLVEADGRQP
ncbi:MAG: hypothetical protein JO368_12080, partial [Acidimicrobiales bacterium]|nr:hypothetical protein [Acidimicrobiales bacterium]